MSLDIHFHVLHFAIFGFISNKSFVFSNCFLFNNLLFLNVLYMNNCCDHYCCGVGLECFSNGVNHLQLYKRHIYKSFPFLITRFRYVNYTKYYRICLYNATMQLKSDQH